MPASEHGHVITLEPPGNGRQCAGSFSHAYLPTHLPHTPTPRQSQTLCAQSTRDCETSLCVRGRGEVRWLLFHFYFCSAFVLESLPICPAPRHCRRLCLAWLVVLFAGIELENVFISPERHSISTWPARSAAIKSLMPSPPLLKPKGRQSRSSRWPISTRYSPSLPTPRLHCIVRVFVISCRVPTVPCEAVRNANAVP